MVFNIFKAGIIFVTLLLVDVKVYADRSHHFSSYSDEPGRFLSAIDQYRKSQPGVVCTSDITHIKAGIVTHHLLASGMMAAFFECLASTEKPERIILIGPDHYGKSRAGIASSALPWLTPFGEIRSHKDTVAEIAGTLALSEDVEAFSGEHSIGALVPFIRYYFPDSTVVPLILQKNVPRDHLISLKRLIAKYLNDPFTIVLLSMDFTHNQTSEEADRRDEVSRQVIGMLDYEQTDKLDVDCHPGLKVLLAALRERRGMRARFLNHTNSAKITGQAGLTNVTSYFTIVFEEQSSLIPLQGKAR